MYMSTTDKVEHDAALLNSDIETACEVMHDAYEEAANATGWETQKASRKPWAEVPEANKETMRVAVSALLDWQSERPREDPAFRTQLTRLLNSVSAESGSDTADFILADYLLECLRNLDRTIKNREVWNRLPL
jgi:aminoglycoside/choline kinase family phosphotransferase